MSENFDSQGINEAQTFNGQEPPTVEGEESATDDEQQQPPAFGKNRPPIFGQEPPTAEGEESATDDEQQQPLAFGKNRPPIFGQEPPTAEGEESSTDDEQQQPPAFGGHNPPPRFGNNFMPPPDMKMWGNDAFAGEEIFNGDTFSVTNELTELTESNGANISLDLVQDNFGGFAQGEMMLSAFGRHFASQQAAQAQTE